MTRGASQKTCLCYSLSLRLRSLPPAMRQGHCRTPRGRSAAPRSFPSLRGSGRFAVATRRGSATPHAGAAALRPDHSLHCGAVVASRWRRGAAAPRPTRAQPRCAPIIPFIAGQWSLRGGDAARQRHAPRGRSRAAPRSFPSLRGSGRFAVATRRGSATPHAGAALRPDHSLHCGAVVASRWRRGAAAPRPTRAQPRCAPIIPFIAGQWSLRGGDAARQRHAPRGRSAAPRSFPSLRGSGRFFECPPRRAAGGQGFNPLHCGAVVASDDDAARQRHAPRGRSRAAPLSLSPSLRGSGRFAVATRRGSATPHAGAAALRPYHSLHCGAVVASQGVRLSLAWGSRGFNPLHCGAVVASRFGP
jgi:hypothetical protein